MELKNKIEIRLENLEKCYILADSDCTLGQFYDFAVAFSGFILEKMKAAQPQPLPQPEAKEIIAPDMPTTDEVKSE